MTDLKTPPKSIHERIAWARKRKGISQERLAEMVGTSRRHVIRWEKTVLPRQEFQERLAEALDQDPEFFNGDAGEDDEDESELSLDALLARVVNDAVRKAMAST